MRAPLPRRRTTRPARPPVVEAYGLSIASDYPLRFNHARGYGRPDVTFDVVDSAPRPDGWQATPASFEALDPATGSDVRASVLVADGCTVVRFRDAADFFVWDDRIACVVHDGSLEHMVEPWLFGIVLTLWLELRGLPTLHAASVVVRGHAIGFLGTDDGGSSTLAMTMVAGGANLLAGDQLPIERVDGRLVARAAYPQMHVRPDQAAHLLGTSEGFEPVRNGSSKVRVPVGPDAFGTFERRAKPIGALYLPERAPSDGVEIVSVPFDEALALLVRHSYLVGVHDALGLAPERLRTFSDVLDQAPLRRLRFPSDMARAADVRDAVLADLANLEPPAPQPRLRRRGP